MLWRTKWDVLESNRAERKKIPRCGILAKEPDCRVGRTGIEPVTSNM
jgi:hypothetical protein